MRPKTPLASAKGRAKLSRAREIESVCLFAILFPSVLLTILFDFVFSASEVLLQLLLHAGWFLVCLLFFFSFCRGQLVSYGLARHGIFIFSRSFRARASHDAAADDSVFVGFVREDGAPSAFWSAAEDLAGGCGHGEASRLRRGNAG
jgi:hypothetical protein